MVRWCEGGGWTKGCSLAYMQIEPISEEESRKLCAWPFRFTDQHSRHIHRRLSWNFSARKANLGRDNNASIRSLRIEIGELMRMCSQNNLDKFAKKLHKNTSPTFFIEDTHLPQKISKCISGHLITRTANEKTR
jgi:hypothetical protein